MSDERVQLNVRISPDIARRLEEVSAERIVSKQLLVEVALREFFDRLSPVDEAVRTDRT